jgi:hypothetical protein
MGIMSFAANFRIGAEIFLSYLVFAFRKRQLICCLFSLESPAGIYLIRDDQRSISSSLAGRICALNSSRYCHSPISRKEKIKK